MACRKRGVEARGKPQRRLLGREVEEYCQRESPPHAVGVSYPAEYSGGGKAHYMGKDVTEVRSPHRTLLPDTVGSDHQQPTCLRGRANKAKADKRHRFRDLYRCLDAAVLMDCWHDRNKEAASGVDNVTAEAYAANLHANSEALVQRLKAQRYRATLVRRCYMPQENGQERPLGLPAREDKLVQLAGAQRLTALYAQDFLGCSYGSRPGRGALAAVRDRTFDLQYGTYGYVVEVEVQGFFNHLAHPGLVDMRRVRMDDRAVLPLLRKWLKAGILEPDGQVIPPETGTPQGGTVSPVLAKVYVHDALDLWFPKVVKAHGRAEALLCRYADDWVGAFRYQDDAERFDRVLPKRRKQCNLQVAPEKPHLLRFSRCHPRRQRRCTFRGFEFYWRPDRQGVPRVMRRTARKKLQAACRRLTEGMRQPRHLPGRAFLQRLNTRLRGHYNDYGVRGNSRALHRCFNWAMDCPFKWRNRRGGKRRRFLWEQCTQILDRVKIARPRLPEVRRRSVYA
jgi:RNA-directed DNA polymerase